MFGTRINTDFFSGVFLFEFNCSGRDQPFYIILNLAVGGSWVGNPDENTSFDDNPYVVDYVRVYQKDSYDEDVTRPEKEFSPRDPDEEGNYIVNGTFEDAESLTDDEDWKFMTANGGVAEAVIEDGRMHITTIDQGSVDYSVQLVQANIPLQKGATYQVSFDASADEYRTMNVDIKAPDHGYQSYMPTQTPEMNSQTRIYTYDFVMQSDSDENARLEFNMGAMGFDSPIRLDNVDSSANASYVVDSLNEDNALDVTVNNTGDQDWKVQIKQNNVPLEKGQTYTLQFKAKSDMERTIRVVIQGQENRGWAVYSSDNLVTLGLEFQTFTDKFTMNEDTDLNAFLSICLGNVDEQITTQHRVVIDDISLTMEEAPTPTPTPTPSPKPTPTPAPTYKFSDVQNPKHAYFNAIYWAADAGITKGYPDGTFGIDKPCTRGEMMMFLWRYAGKPAPKTVSKSPFKDVPKTHTFYKAILWGSQKGITKGYSDGTFGLNRNVSRGECMMFLWRLKGKPAPKTVAKSPFKDVSKTHTFYKAILWGSQKKVTTGYTSGAKKGTFGINENCTRGQIVTFLYRAK